MNKNKPNVLYLLGAGRSGTTMLTTVLNNHPEIFAVGEMDQFLDYVKDNKDCSCGEDLTECVFWSQILKDLDVDEINSEETVNFSNRMEKHYMIPRHLLKRRPNSEYSEIIDKIFGALDRNVSKPWLLDSSKYIARYLLLRKNKNLRVKGIYMVRDVRGVIHSFGKNVQTPKKPLPAIAYYVLVNLWGLFVSLIDSKVIRIRYEDFVNDPEAIISKLEKHIFNESKTESKLYDQAFDIPHIIAGNRLRSEKRLVIKKDVAWKSNISRPKQVLYYFLAAPIMLFNWYKI